MSSDTIECPFCAETIKVKAKKCRYCGEFLDSGATQESILQEHAQALQEIKTMPENGGTAVTAPIPPPPQTAPAEAVAEAVAAVKTEDTVETEAPMVQTGDDEEHPASPVLVELYKKIDQMPDSEEKQQVIATIEKLKVEAKKGDEADESKVEDLVKGVISIIPDAAEITINTMINPTSGALSLVQKVAKRVAKKYQEKSDTEKGELEEKETATETPEPKAESEADSEEPPAEIDADRAAEALDELHEKLAEAPDTPEKQAVAEALEQLEHIQEDADDTKETISGIISGVADSIPELVETAVHVTENLTEEE